MEEKRYEVIDDTGNAIATNMDLRTALLLIEASCEKYYNEKADYRLKETYRGEKC